MTTTTFPTDPGSAPRRNLVRSLASACVVGVLLIGMCVSCSDQHTSTITSSGATAATGIATTTPETTSHATVAPTTTPETTSRTNVAPDTSVIAAPPGRLPAVDATATITALFPAPFAAGDPQTLATETTNRLHASFGELPTQSVMIVQSVEKLPAADAPHDRASDTYRVTLRANRALRADERDLVTVSARESLETDR